MNEVELTDEERRIIAEIEAYEREHTSGWRRSRLLVGRTSQRLIWSSRRLVWTWVLAGLGSLIVAGALVVSQPLVAFVGFVILLVGVTQICVRQYRGRRRSLLPLRRRVRGRGRAERT